MWEESLQIEGVVLIDCPVRPTDSERWQNDLRSLSPLGIRYLISTDFHGDHATGSAFVKGVTFIASQVVYEKIAGKYAFSKKSFIETLRDQGHTEEAAKIAKAVIPCQNLFRRQPYSSPSSVNSSRFVVWVVIHPPVASFIYRRKK